MQKIIGLNVQLNKILDYILLVREKK